jgi:DNA mismatch repair endonuclease MutH
MSSGTDMPYDTSSVLSIFEYAQKLKGKTLKEATGLKSVEGIKADINKGLFGTLLEEYYFRYMPNSDKTADFKEAGIELKSTPLKKTSKGYRAKERLVFNIINYMDIIEENWEESGFLKKNQLLLLIFYLWERDKALLDYLMKYVDLWNITEHDADIIRQDWQKIVDKVKAGKAHEISEADTFYLSACRKGAGGDKDWKEQPKSREKALQRAFSFKPRYVNLIINELHGREEEFESVMKGSDLKHKSFEEVIYSKIDKFRGMSYESLCKQFGLDPDAASKAKYALLAARMLGAKKHKAEEFEKADIEVKAIRLNRKGYPKESMSFPYFKYMDIIEEEDWEDSSIKEMFDKKFFFMIFQEDDEGELSFKRGLFWNIPFADLGHIKELWLLVKDDISKGIFRNTAQEDNPVSHIRPHAQNKQDTLPTPDGKQEMKRCFWFNANYLKEQIDKNG